TLPGPGQHQHGHQDHQHRQGDHRDGQPRSQKPSGGPPPGPVQLDGPPATSHAPALLPMGFESGGPPVHPTWVAPAAGFTSRAGQKSKSSSPESSPESAFADTAVLGLPLDLLPLHLRRVTSAVANRRAAPPSPTFRSPVMRPLPARPAHSLCWSFPVTNTRSPLPTDSAKFSPCARHSEQRSKVGSPSTHSSLSRSKNRSL